MQYSIQIFCQETISFIFEIEFVYNYVFCSRNKASGEVRSGLQTHALAVYNQIIADSSNT